MSGGSHEAWSEPVDTSKKTKKQTNNRGPESESRRGLPSGMSPAQFLLFYLKRYKEKAGIKDKVSSAKMNPSKVLSSLKTTEEKLAKLEEERNRFQTQDMRLFNEWKKEACARELSKQNKAIEEHKLLLEELRKLEEEYRKLVSSTKNASGNSQRKKKRSPEEYFEDFLRKQFGESDDTGEDSDFDESIGDDEDYSRHKEHFEGNRGEFNFPLFYETTGWTEDFLREVSRLSNRDRKSFISHFYNELVEKEQGLNFYDFYSLTNRHAERLFDLDEERALNVAFQSGDTASQIKIHYRKLMRELHPDLRADAPPTDFEKELFNKVQGAYDNQDLAGLKRSEIDLALFRGKLDADADPRLLKKLQQEKAEKLREVKKDIVKMKKNVEWNFESRSHDEKQGLATEISEEIIGHTREILSHRHLIMRDIKMLSMQIKLMAEKTKNKSNSTAQKHSTQTPKNEVPPSSESIKFHEEMDSFFG